MDVQNAENKPSRGRPRGIPRDGRYGLGVKTKVVRVPVAVADNIQEILASFEAIKTACDTWADEMDEATLKSKTGELPVRYYHGMKLLTELRALLGD